MPVSGGGGVGSRLLPALTEPHGAWGTTLHTARQEGNASLSKAGVREVGVERLVIR